MSGEVFAGLVLIVIGVSAIAFRGLMAKRIRGINRRWEQLARWTPEPRTLRAFYLAFGVLMIGVGLLAMCGILK